MTVEALSFGRTGYVLDPEMDVDEQIQGLVHVYEKDFVALPAREYDLKVLPGGKRKQQLVVLTDGTAVVRTVPLDIQESVRTASSDGKPFAISTPGKIFYISTYSSNTKQHVLQELFRYSLGPNPE